MEVEDVSENALRLAKEGMIQARSVLRDTPAELNKPERRRVIEGKIERLTEALNAIDALPQEPKP